MGAPARPASSGSQTTVMVSLMDLYSLCDGPHTWGSATAPWLAHNPAVPGPGRRGLCHDLTRQAMAPIRVGRSWLQDSGGRPRGYQPRPSKRQRTACREIHSCRQRRSALAWQEAL